jgi:branched-chain amino acid transport system substrate-binding protein
VAVAAALTLAGCAGGPADVEGPVTVYVSAPDTRDGRDVADGARLALAQAGGKAGELEVRARYLTDPSTSSEVALAAVGDNAREAAEDSSTAAYIGDFSSGATRTSAPILNEAGVAQVSPAATAADLTRDEALRPVGEVTFTRVIPSDAVGGGAAIEPSSGFREAFRAEFGRPAGPYAAYGYEAMAVVLDAIEQRDTDAGNLRSSVSDSLLRIERLDESAIGPYSFTTEGETTLRPG